MNLLLFGASITAQSRDDSIWRNLKAILSDAYPLADMGRLAFPSSVFNGPGYLCIDNVIALNPTHVILDWLSTRESSFDEFKIRSVYSRLHHLGINIITLAMPRLDTWSKKPYSYNQCLDASRACGSSFLDVSYAAQKASLTIGELTRDGVHTSKKGALYASSLILDSLASIEGGNSLQIYSSDYLGDHREDPDWRQKWHASCSPREPSPFSMFSVGNELQLSPNQVCRIKLVPLSPFPSCCSEIEIWSLQTVGPYSPLVDVESKYSCSTHSLWDEWCHYERHSFKKLASLRVDAADLDDKPFDLRISISSLLPDRSTSRAACIWPQLDQLKVRIHNLLYCIGAVVVNVEIV